MTQTHILLVTGPAGVGKSTLCWEMSHQLAEAQVAHAVIESDELDRVFPKPTREELQRLRPGLSDISTLNLAALWSTYRALGHSRLIMSGVMLHLSFDRRWIAAAIPDAELTVVRLRAGDQTLVERLHGREIGAGAAAQIERSLRQAERMAAEPADAVHLTVSSDGMSPAQMATDVLKTVGWLS